MITELNDPSYVTIQGGEGNCTWCDGGLGYNGTRVRGQMLEVTSVSGNTVGFDPPLYTAYSGTPLVAPMTAITYAGVENLQVYANNTGYKASFQLSGCAYCWLKGIEANYTDGDFVQVHYGFRDEIRDSYFSNAYQHSAGDSDSDIFIVDKTTASLVEDNIVERAHVSIMINWGAAGNVIAYNYMMGEFDSGGTNFVIGGIGVHGAHPQFNLIEGNVMNQYYPDQVWGSSAYNTSFRNWTIGTGKACKPLTGRGAVTCSGTNGWYPFQASRAMQIGHLSRYYNFVGNVSGSDAQQAVGSSHVGLLEYSSSRSYDSTNYNFTFGYGESNDSGSGSGCSGGTAPCHSSDAYATAFLHGNYTQADGSINWAAGVTHSLPVSFYLTAKPSWWGSLPWPSIGPDVTGESGAGGHASLSSSNPAMDCYNNQMHGSDGGAGSPLTFNPGNCYGNAQTLAPPTDLKAVTH